MKEEHLRSPQSPKYLPPASPDEEECGAIAPSPPFSRSWGCTRAKGHADLDDGHDSHDGASDHAAHHDLGRVMMAAAGEVEKVSELPDMVARWPRKYNPDI